MCGLDMLQARAPFRTIYDYGESDTPEVVDTLQSALSKNDRLFAPIDINYSLAKYDSPFLDMATMRSRERMLEVISDVDIAGVVYSLGTLTVEQYEQIIHSRPIQDALSDRFQKIQIGSYEVWLPETTSPTR